MPRRATPAERRLTAPTGRRSRKDDGCATPTPALKSGMAAWAESPRAWSLSPAETGQPPGRATLGSTGCRARLPATRGAQGRRPRVWTPSTASRGGPDGTGGRPRERELGDGDGNHAPLRDGNRDDRDDDDGGDRGPARGGGRVANLRPGPDARERHGVEDQGTHGAGTMQAGPSDSAQVADGGAQVPAATEAQASAGDEDNPPEDPGQEGAGSWGWGWWNTNTWQGRSSDRGWRGRPGRDERVVMVEPGQARLACRGLQRLRWRRPIVPEARTHRGGARSPSYQGRVDRGAHRRPPGSRPPRVPSPRLVGKMGARRFHHLQEDGVRQVQGEDEACQRRHGGPRG